MQNIPTRQHRLPPEVRNILLILAGLCCTTAAYNLLLIPNDIAAGGFTGVGQILNELFGIRVGLVSIILNVPLFLVSMRTLGWRFGVRSLITMFALSFLIDTLTLPVLTQDMLLATVFGGVLAGVGFGLIIRGSATTGGTDMLASLVHRYIPVINIGTAITLFDGLVIVASAFVFEMETALYALVCVFLMNYVVDLVLNGPDISNCYIIISDHSEEIAARVLKEMERGMTSLKGKGVYSNSDKEVLLCVINRFESMTLRRVIFSVDPEAFVIVEKVNEVFGEGFQRGLSIPQGKEKK